MKNLISGVKKKEFIIIYKFYSAKETLLKLCPIKRFNEQENAILFVNIYIFFISLCQFAY